MQLDTTAVLRLKAIAEVDPGTLVRVLQLFQARNVVPWRVSAHRTQVHDGDALEIEVEVQRCDLAPQALAVIAAKMNELATVLGVIMDD